MSVTDLEQRIAQLEDIEAIKKLKASYCLHVDHANEEGWVSLFTQDAIWDRTSSAASRDARQSADSSGRSLNSYTSPFTT